MQLASTLSDPSPIHLDAPADRAAANLRANLRALARRQPTLAKRPVSLPSNLNWVFARDGSITAMLDGVRWWAGCSVPLAAARFMLKGMDVRGIVGCFLKPLHAAQLRVALDLLTASQAVLALVPDPLTFAVLLHAEDFSIDIAAGRLWFATGDDWESQVRGIFRDNPGLATPVEFVRPITADAEATNALIDPAQGVFAKVSSDRTAQLQEIRQQWRPSAAGVRRICLLAPSEFRLWDDAAILLAEMDFNGQGIEVHRLDSDCPTSSSPLSFALAACQCDAVLAANVFRSHLPGVIPDAMPWVTWATTPMIPPAREAGPNDRVVLSGSSWLDSARKLGWEESRLAIASWPALALSHPPQRHLSVVADTSPLGVPKEIEEYSSQVLLWELIRDDLARDPFLAVNNIEDYLNSRRARFQIGDDGFDPSVFIRRLIIPAVQQGLARRMIRDSVPLRLFGRGWDSLDGLSGFHGGPVTSRSQLAAIISNSVALVNVWPWDEAHAIEAAGRPIIRTRRMHDLLSDIRQAFNGTLKPPALHDQRLSPELIAGVLRASLE